MSHEIEIFGLDGFMRRLGAGTPPFEETLLPVDPFTSGLLLCS